MTLWQILSRPFRRAPRRPLAARRPERASRAVPLGMEGLDLDLVEQVNRRNNSLERTNSVRMDRHSGDRASFLSVTDPQVDPMPEDETYAKRFHQAFQKKGQSR